MREAGLTENEIMDLPTYRVNLLYWAALRINDVWTVKEAPIEEIKLEDYSFPAFDISEDEE